MLGELQLFFENVLEHLVGVLRVEGREAEDHFVEQGAQAVEVDAEVVSLLEDHLGRHVPGIRSN